MNKSIIQIEGLTASELEQRFSQLETMLSNVMSGLNQNKGDEWMTREQVIKMLGINASTLWHWCKKSKLKSYGLGNKVFFKRSEVEQALIPLTPEKRK